LALTLFTFSSQVVKIFDWRLFFSLRQISATITIPEYHKKFQITNKNIISQWVPYITPKNQNSGKKKRRPSFLVSGMNSKTKRRIMMDEPIQHQDQHDVFKLILYQQHVLKYAYGSDSYYCSMSKHIFILSKTKLKFVLVKWFSKEVKAT